jgi:hypothetical protein
MKTGHVNKAIDHNVISIYILVLYHVSVLNSGKSLTIKTNIYEMETAINILFISI